jgi:3-oxoacyl-[acyl-carrier-protein] synthase-1
MNPLAITDYTLTTALGAGVEQNWLKLRDGISGLSPCRFANILDLHTWTGEVDGVDQIVLPAALEKFDCRNNRLAYLGLEQDSFRNTVLDAAKRYGKDRVAVFVGTSTSGIHQTELAYRSLSSQLSDTPVLPHWFSYEGTHNTYSIAEFVRQSLDLSGMCVAISTACSSSAKVFASAHRALEAGFCDAVVVGGVDSLCLTTLYGFNALQLIASDICRPSDTDRTGLSIGEAAGFALLERGTDAPTAPQLLGYGESSDAFHMSAPHPEGDGAVQAMQGALTRAGLIATEIDYINLHGTGTPTNDLTESIAVTRMFATGTPCSSTKGFTGHTLGAAGIVEAIFAVLGIEHGFMPVSLNTCSLDAQIKANILLQAREAPMTRVLSNSFGFGGSNCSLILGKAPT